MARLVLATAGAVVGGMVGGTVGAQVGWAVGSMVGGTFEPNRKQEGPRLSDARVSGSSYGTTLPWVSGSPIVAGQIIWASSKRETAQTQTQGKGGGGGVESTSYTYSVDLMLALTENEVRAINRVWINNVLVANGTAASGSIPCNDNQWASMTLYSGGFDQLPDPTYEAAVGIGNAPAYRTRCVVVVQDLQLGSGGSIPNITFEIAGSRAITNPVYSNVVFQVTNPGGGSYDESCQNNRGVSSISATAAIYGSSSSRNLRGSNANITYDTVNWNNLLWDNGTGLTFEAVIYSGTPNAIAIANCAPEILANAYLNTNSYDQFGFKVLVNYTLNLLYFNLHYVGQVSIPFTAPGTITLGIQQPAAPSAGNPTKVYLNGTLVWSYAGVVWNSVDYTLMFGGIGTNDVAGANCPFSYLRARLRAGVHSLDYGELPPAVCATTLTPTNAAQSLATTVDALMLRAGYQAGQWDTTALTSMDVRGFISGSVAPTRSVLEVLASAFDLDVVTQDKIYFLPRSPTVRASIGYDALGVSDSGSAVALPIKISNELELPAQVAITYPNIYKDYQEDTQYSDRLLSSQTSTNSVGMPLAMVPSEAKAIADRLILRTMSQQLSTTISVNLDYAHLFPGDIISVQDRDGYAYRMRITTRHDVGSMIKFDCESDLAGDAQAVAPGADTDQRVTTVLVQGDTSIAAMDIPLLRDSDNYAGLYLAISADGPDWKGAAVADSIDDTTFTNLYTLTEKTVIGTAPTALGGWAGGAVFDEFNALQVVVLSGELSSVTRDALLASATANVLLVGSEIIQFRSATLTAANTYTLAGLLRGLRGTERHCNGHLANEQCVLLGSVGMRYATSSTTRIGMTRYYRAATFGQKISTATSDAVAETGESLRPFSPCHGMAQTAGADLAVSWIRRTRLAVRYVGAAGIAVPLGEASESYTLKIYAGATLKRTVTSATSAYTYTAALMAADSFTTGQTITFTVAQVSEAVGDGHSHTFTGKVP